MFVVVYKHDFNFNLEGMGLVLGQSWMVALINGRILFCPHIIMYCEICCCLLSCKCASDRVSTWATFDVNI